MTEVHHFSRGFDHSNLVNSFRGSKYLPTIYIRFSYVYIFNVSTWNVSFDKDNNIFCPWAEHREPGTFSELAVIGAFCRCAIAENRIRQQNFFVIFLTPKIKIYHLNAESSRLSQFNTECWSTLNPLILNFIKWLLF